MKIQFGFVGIWLVIGLSCFTTWLVDRQILEHYGLDDMILSPIIAMSIMMAIMIGSQIRYGDKSPK